MATQYMNATQLASAAAYGASKTIDSGHNWLPDFKTNPSTVKADTDNIRNTKSPSTGTSTSLSVHWGTCQAHWGTNVVYNQFTTDGRFPADLTTNSKITYTEINYIKNE